MSINHNEQWEISHEDLLKLPISSLRILKTSENLALRHLHITKRIMSQPATFTLFPNLPIEIRLKIWRHARQSKPQVIKMQFFLPREIAIFPTPPSPIGACRESYQETSRVPISYSDPPLRLNIAGSQVWSRVSKSSSDAAVLDFATDTVCIKLQNTSLESEWNPWTRLLNYIPRFSNLRFLAITEVFFVSAELSYICVTLRDLLDGIRWFAELESVILDDLYFPYTGRGELFKADGADWELMPIERKVSVQAALDQIVNFEYRHCQSQRLPFVRLRRA